MAKKLIYIVASYLIVASALVIYFNAPVLPVLCGGLVALAWTLIQHFTAKR